MPMKFNDLYNFLNDNIKKEEVEVKPSKEKKEKVLPTETKAPETTFTEGTLEEAKELISGNIHNRDYHKGYLILKTLIDENNDPEACYYLGKQLGYLGRSDLAFPYYKKAYESGHTGAILQLCIAYNYGIDDFLKRDGKLAEKYKKEYFNALQEDIKTNPNSYARLALYYTDSMFDNVNYKKGIEYFEKGASLNDGECMYRLSSICSNSMFKRYIKTDMSRSLLLLIQAATINYHTEGDNACYELGKRYLNGKNGAKVNKNLAFEYFLKAAEQGEIFGIQDVISCYKDGVGTKKDLKEADKWLKLYEKANLTYEKLVGEEPEEEPEEVEEIQDEEDKFIFGEYFDHQQPFVPTSDYHAALNYLFGHISIRNFGLAKKVLTPYLNNNDKEAYYLLGKYKFDKNAKVIDPYMLKAAELGHPFAEYYVASYCALRLEYPRTPSNLSLDEIEKLGKENFNKALETLTNLVREDPKVPSYPDAYYYLGELYDMKEFHKVDLKMKAKLNTMGAMLGHSESCFAHYCDLKYSKQYLENPNEDPVRPLSVAVNNNHPHSCYILAEDLYKGEGVVQDKESAYKLYYRAAMLGEWAAMETLVKKYPDKLTIGELASFKKILDKVRPSWNDNSGFGLL